MRQPRPVTVDFESHKIEGRPAYPPRPVGVAIKPWGKLARYFAWGHPAENNCTEAQARAAVLDAWRCKDGVLCHNAKFDVDVAETFFGAPRLSWDKYHDTLFLLFLDDPHAADLALKSSAARLLGLPPEEQDAVVEWLVQHQPVPGVRLSRAPKSDNYAGAYVAHAPGGLVGRYACGDVDRTAALFELLHKKTLERGMTVAYDRERRLMPILLDCERRGVPVDLRRLRADVKLYTDTFKKLDTWVLKRLRDPDLNIDSGTQLVWALLKAGKADEAALGVTATGKPRSDKDALDAAVTDRVLAAVLRYRAQLKTCLGTFMEPWLVTAGQSDGLIYTNWNQTRQASGGGTVGTRTGRLSSNPNFQNVPNVFKPIFKHELKGLPAAPFALPPLPSVRGYIAPPKGYVLIDRDYSQQELRILAHFEDGKLRDAYLADQWLDVHDYARELINGMLGKNFERKPIKNTGFGLIYGMGLGTLAEKSGTSVEEAKEVKNAYLAIFPGLKAMYADMKYRAKSNLPLRTWGGREYYCEPPRLVEGRVREFDYKMVNALIQGSAADCTKEALIRYEAARPAEHLPLLTVHDEILCMVPRKALTAGMTVLRTAMESVEFDVPMLSEGAWSAESWTAMKDYDKKGALCAY